MRGGSSVVVKNTINSPSPARRVKVFSPRAGTWLGQVSPGPATPLTGPRSWIWHPSPYASFQLARHAAFGWNKSMTYAHDFNDPRVYFRNLNVVQNGTPSRPVPVGRAWGSSLQGPWH
jgi:hypothetical protein